MIYLHYKSPVYIYPPEPEDIYLYFDSDGQSVCNHNICLTCPLHSNFICNTPVKDLLTTYPNPTILTPDTHPEIFL